MYYTLNLIKTGINMIVPYANKLPGMQDMAPTKIDKKHAQNRLRVSHAMNRAIKKGKLSPSYSAGVRKMKNNAMEKLSEAACHTNTQYVCSQIGKTATALDFIIPGAGILPTNISRVSSLNTLYQCAQKEPNTKEKVVKVVKMALPLVMAATHDLWKPVLENTVTPVLMANIDLVAAGSAVSIGTFIAIDVIAHTKR